MPASKKVFFVVDVESTGPDFSRHSMYQFACVPVLPNGQVLQGTAWELELLPKGEHNQKTLAFLKRELGITLETLAKRPAQIPAEEAMRKCDAFIKTVLANVGAEKAVFVADNLAFDWGFMHTYFLRFCGRNPFGYAGRNIPCLSLGLYGTRNAWKQFITRAHTHHALDDAAGNAGALAHMIQEGLNIE